MPLQHRIATRDRLIKHPDPVEDLAVDSAASQFEGVTDTAEHTDEIEVASRS
jgi:hypothetical protein